MYDSMRTAAGAAPLSTAVQASGPHDARGAARLLQQAALHASEPPQHSGISPLVWKMSNPQHRASLLRQHHFKGIFGRRKSFLSALSAASQGTASSASATQGQAAPALGLWRHHGLFRLAHHSSLLGHTAHGGWLHKLTAAVHAAAAQSAQPAASAPGTAAQSTSASATPLAHGAQSAAEAASLASITQQFQTRFASSAKDPAAFAALLKQAFGDHYDAAKAEGIRQQTLAGDFSWMPKVQLASASQLKDTSGAQGEGVAMGCYSAGDDTIYLNRDLLASDPAQAEKVLAEEMGHALDARLNTSDAAGDEGDIFSKLVHGEAISAGQLAEMKADNDHGVIEINGKKTEVEYSLLSKVWKSVTNCVKKVVKAVTNCIKNTLKAMSNLLIGMVTFDFNRVQQGFTQAWDAVKDAANDIKDAVKEAAKEVRKIVKEAFTKLMQSKLFNAVLMVCRFIPIPIVQLVVRVIDVVKAAYMVYQGIKNKSWSAVLSGVATIAGGVSNVAGALGASASTVNTITSVADGLKAASQVYSAASSKNFAQALASGAAAFGAPEGVTSALQTAAKIETAVHAVEDHNYGAALAAGADALGVKAEAKGVIQDVQHAEAAYKAYRKGDYVGMASEAGKAAHVDGDALAVLNSAKSVDRAVHAIEDKNYTQAFSDLKQAGQGWVDFGSDAPKDKKPEDETTFDHVKHAGSAALKGDWSTVIDEAGKALKVEGKTQEFFERAKAIDAGIHAFEDGKYEAGAQQVGQALGLSAGQQETVQDLVHVKRADDAQRKGDNQKALDELGAAFHGTGGVQPWLDSAKALDAGVQTFEDGKFQQGAAQVGQALGLSEGAQEVLVDASHLKNAQQAYRAKDNGKAIDEVGTALKVSGFALEWFNQAKQADAAVHEFEDKPGRPRLKDLAQVPGLAASALRRGAARVGA